MTFFSRSISVIGALIAAAMLAGSKYVVLNPSGAVAKMESNLIVISTVIMLIIVIPVMVAVVFLAWKYRAQNNKAEYDPDWGHSRTIEAYMWGVPIIVVIVLGAITTFYTLKFDPYRRLPIATDKPPLTVQVVSLDWKWLFIYPEQGVASLNELYIPANREIKFEITSEANINAFWVPALGSMVYSMPGMRSKVHLIADHTGVFDGRSANYSGEGFAGMRFKVHAVDDSEFANWIARVKTSPNLLGSKTYKQLALAESNNKVQYYSQVMPGLFYRAANRCTQSGETCLETNMVQAASQTLWGAICSGSGFTPAKSLVWGAEAHLSEPAHSAEFGLNTH